MLQKAGRVLFLLTAISLGLLIFRITIGKDREYPELGLKIVMPIAWPFASEEAIKGASDWIETYGPCPNKIAISPRWDFWNPSVEDAITGQIRIGFGSDPYWDTAHAMTHACNVGKVVASGGWEVSDVDGKHKIVGFEGGAIYLDDSPIPFRKCEEALAELAISRMKSARKFVAKNEPGFEQYGRLLRMANNLIPPEKTDTIVQAVKRSDGETIFKSTGLGEFKHWMDYCQIEWDGR